MLYTYLGSHGYAMLFKNVGFDVAYDRCYDIAAGDMFEVTDRNEVEGEGGITYVAARLVGGRHGFIMARHFKEPYMVCLE